MPSLPLATFDPKRVIVTYAANILTGFGKDIFVSAEHEEDAFTLSVGVDGNGALSFNNNESGTIKLTLFHTSPSNDILMATYQSHRLTSIVPGPFMVKDLNGRALLVCKNAWVKKLPAMSRGKEVQELEWNIGTDRLDLIVGGN